MMKRHLPVPVATVTSLDRSSGSRLLAINKSLAVILALLAWTSCSSAPVWAVSQNRQTATVRAVQRAKDGTVNIHSEKRARQSETLFSSGKENKINGMGTGMVVDERGYIVTNHHVVKEVDSLRVTLADGGSYPARIISYDSKHDLAIIKIDARRPLEVIPFGTSSDLMLGEDVLAIGNAFGYEHSVTRGIISSLSRDVEVNEEQSYENLIQIDAAINPGNSGGPLLNRDGDVIGINVAIRAGAQKIGFAIPIDDARKIVAALLNIERLEEHRHGMKGRDDKQGERRNLIVSSTAPNSPAARAGLQAGDVVLKAGSVDVVDMADFERAMLGRRVGENVSVTVQRNGETQEMELAVSGLASRRQVAQTQAAPPQAPEPRPVVRAQNDDRSWRLLGLKLASINDEEKPMLGRRYNGGMKVTAVRHGSTAQQNGIRSGDILVGLHVWETVNRDNVEFVVSNPQLASFSPLKFYILRGGETLYGYLQVR